MEQEVKWYQEGIFVLFPVSHGKFSVFYLELRYFATGVFKKILFISLRVIVNL